MGNGEGLEETEVRQRCPAAAIGLPPLDFPEKTVII